MRYLDNSATTPVAAAVVEAMLPYLGAEFGNPSSNSDLGQRARAAIEGGREQVATLVGSKPSEVVFTSGATESCFHAIVGAARAVRHKRHVVISAVEHPAVSKAVSFLEGMCDIRVTVVPVEKGGTLNLDRVFDSIEIDTFLLSFMAANNETGILFPVRELAEMARSRGIAMHTDAVQCVGKAPINFADLGVDLLSLTGHKFGGPKGVGALVVREGAAWHPVMIGGGQEGGRRGGTESAALAVALGKAAELCSQRLADDHEPARLAAARDEFERQLSHTISNIKINGHGSPRLPQISSLVVEGTIASELIQALLAEGIYVSAGSACKAGGMVPSHVLTAMGVPALDSFATVRFSFAPEFRIEEVPGLVAEIAPIIEKVRAAGRAAMEMRRS